MHVPTRARTPAAFLLALCAGCAGERPSTAPAPSFDEPTVRTRTPTATLDQLETRIERLETHHTFGDPDLSARRSTRAGFARQLDASVPMAAHASIAGDTRERLLDLRARTWLLQRTHKYDPRTWQHSEQREAALRHFDALHPGNHRSTPTAPDHHVDALHADVFVLETFHAR